LPVRCARRPEQPVPQVPGARSVGTTPGQPGTPRRPAWIPFSPDGSGLKPSSRSPSRSLTVSSTERRSLLVLSISLVLLLGVLVCFLVRFAGLRGWHALFCVLFGFYLASTPLAPYIQTGCRAVARIVAGVGF
jgi:hypothetical protein